MRCLVSECFTSQLLKWFANLVAPFGAYPYQLWDFLVHCLLHRQVLVYWTISLDVAAPSRPVTSISLEVQSFVPLLNFVAVALCNIAGIYFSPFYYLCHLHLVLADVQMALDNFVNESVCESLFYIVWLWCVCTTWSSRCRRVLETNVNYVDVWDIVFFRDIKVFFLRSKVVF